ncbi:MAG: sigma 54-interacting transcriptional regulator [Acidobacteriota bacterium]
MSGSLAAMAGPLEGALFRLQADAVSIGRDADNEISIPDASLSRRHSVVECVGGAHRIRDLESRNGTFVNGVPVTSRTLNHGDQIGIGASRLLFSDDTPAESIPDRPPLSFDENARPGSTVELRPEDSPYVEGSESAARLDSARLAADLRVLLEASRRIAGSRSIRHLSERLIDLLIEALPLDAAAFLWCEPGNLDAAESFGQSRVAGVPAVSRLLATRVLESREAILSRNTAAGESSPTSPSLLESGARSIAVAPLAAFGRLFGVVSISSTSPGPPLELRHLELLSGIGSMAGAAAENLRQREWIETDHRRMTGELPGGTDLVGESRAMLEIHALVSRVAPSEATVLVTGETGTGKELVARAIHRLSRRGTAPFVAINCAALTETLLESELFGHERGAFTGAIAQKRGKLEVAGGGTVFLDEVGDMSPALQAKLLRALQEREIERVGGIRTIRIDARFVAATNRDLAQAMETGAFRQDLFHRLNVVTVAMPALRDRRDDIPLLAGYFLRLHSEKARKELHGFSREARECLLRYDWPGNVRELGNAIERAVVFAAGDIVLPEDLPSSLLETSPLPSSGLGRYHDAVNEAKRVVIRRALEEAKGTFTEAARLLGVHSNYLHRLVSRLDLRREIEK